MRKQLPSDFTSRDRSRELTIGARYYFALIIIVALVLCSLPLPAEARVRTADNTVTARTENDGDLSTTKFATLEGMVTVNLPPDTAAGDQISGTVVAEPKGTTPEEKASNQDALEGYVVEVANQPSKESSVGQWTIPPKARSVDVVLKKKSTGEIISQANVPVEESGGVAGVVIAATSDNNKVNGSPTTEPKATAEVLRENEPKPKFHVPQVAQAGKYVRIIGGFDGNFRSTEVKVGGQVAPPLAESPRGSIVKIPQSITGPTKIDVTKNGVAVASCPLTVLGIKLAAGNLRLKRGETSQLSVTVSGVRDMKTPAKVQLDNKFPQTMRMEGGDSQVLTVPAGLATDALTQTRTLTGVEVGAFAITAVVTHPPCAAGNCAECNTGSAASEPATPTGVDSSVRPVKGIDVVVQKEPGNSAARVFTTDSNGEINMGVLPAGSYSMTVKSSIENAGRTGTVASEDTQSGSAQSRQARFSPTLLSGNPPGSAQSGQAGASSATTIAAEDAYQITIKNAVGGPVERGWDPMRQKAYKLANISTRGQSKTMPPVYEDRIIFESDGKTECLTQIKSRSNVKNN